MATPLCADDIRTKFSRAMSEMYRAEVPQYAELLAIVAEVNREVLQRDSALASRFGPAEILRRIRSLEELRDHLGRNVHEALAIEVAFLIIFTA